MKLMCTVLINGDKARCVSQLTGFLRTLSSPFVRIFQPSGDKECMMSYSSAAASTEKQELGL